MNNTRVLSIIVTYNAIRNDWINKCLTSLEESEVKTDVFVVDNASTDNTVDLIKGNYKEVELIESKENLGFSLANNLGFDKAIKEDYDYIFLLNQDAWVNKDTITLLISTHKNNQAYGILSPIHLNGQNDNLDLNFSKYLLNRNGEGRQLYFDHIVDNSLKSIYPVDFVNAACWLVSNECMSKVGKFDSVLFQHYGEDTNYANRVLSKGIKIGIVPKSYVYHDREQRGVVQQTKTFKNQLLVFSVNGSNVNISSNIESMDLEISRQKRRIKSSSLKWRFRDARQAFLLVKKMKARKMLIIERIKTY